MIKFRQKEFIALTSILTGAQIAQAGAGILQGNKQNKIQKEQAEEANRIQERQNIRETRLQQQQNQKMNELQKQQTKIANQQFNQNLKLARKTGLSVQPTITATQPQQQQFSRVTEGAGFVKNLGTIARGRGLNKVLAGAAITGAVSGTGAYLVDKAIQKDVKKSGILKIEKPELTEEEKAAKKKKRNRKLLMAAGTGAALVGGGIAAKKGKFGQDVKDLADKVTPGSVMNKVKSGARTVKEATKDYFAPIDNKTGKRRPDTLNLAITGVSTVAPAAIYALKKKKLKDQIKQSEEDSSEEKEKTYSRIKVNTENLKNKNGYKGTAADDILRARTNRLYSPKGRTEAYKVKDWWNKFKKKPGDTLLDTLSFRTGGGGKKGVRGFGKDLIKIGKETGNETSQKVGRYIVDNPKKAMLGSAALGLGVIRTAKRKLGGATSKVLEKVDPNAYAYAKYGAQVVPQNKKEEEKEDE